MIKFFRRIRQRLLSENRFSKYLVYAIGEIVLVVIGILLALQVNNWNEERKFKKAEVTQLNKFLEELILDSLMIERNLAEYGQMLNLHSELHNNIELEKSASLKTDPNYIRRYLMFDPGSLKRSELFINKLANARVREQLLRYNSRLELTIVTNKEFIAVIKSIRSFLAQQEAYNVSSILGVPTEEIDTELSLITEDKLMEIASRTDFQQLMFEANLKLKYLCLELGKIKEENTLLKDLIKEELRKY